MNQWECEFNYKVRKLRKSKAIVFVEKIIATTMIIGCIYSVIGITYSYANNCADVSFSCKNKYSQTNYPNPEQNLIVPVVKPPTK